MILGVTGTQRGGTPKQCETLQDLFILLSVHVLHLGDCIGVDAQAYHLAKHLHPRIILHPPIDPKKRAFLRGDESKPPLPYLDRNRALVAASRDGVIALPSGRLEQFRGSGTWATIRYARHAQRRLWIVWPDGELIEDTHGH